MNNSTKEIVVIVGTGRSGTSLLVQILLELGMFNQNNFGKSSEEEPLGLFEDQEIVDVHKSMLSVIGVHAMAPHADRKCSADEKELFKAQLKDIVAKRISDSNGMLWGFKDPRTTLFLPIWQEVFNEMGYAPKYILAQRDPISVVSSMMKQNDNGQAFAELAWLVRTCEAIINTNGRLFIVNYEDWFNDKSADLGNSLANYLGLSSLNIDTILERKVLDNLNRAKDTETRICNSLVNSMYKSIRNFSGDAFNSSELLGIAENYNEKMSEFYGWAEFANRYYKNFEIADAKATALENKSRKLLKKNRQLERSLKTHAALEVRVQALTDHAKSLSGKAELLNEKIVRLEGEKSNLKSELDKWREKHEESSESRQILIKKFDKLLTSGAYQLGSLLVLAFTQPRKNLIFLPYDLIRLARREKKEN